MPFCTQCGAKLRDGANFCTKCGKAVRRSNRQRFTPTRSINRPIDTNVSPRTPIRTVEKTSSEDESPNILEPIIFREKEEQEKIEESPNSSDLSYNEEHKTSIENTVLSKGEFEQQDLIPSELITEQTPIVSESEKKDEQDFLIKSTKELLVNQLQKIKYSFKEIENIQPFIFKTTFLAGSLEKLIWDFSAEDKIVLEGTVSDVSFPDLKFSIEIPENHPPYNWKDPYAYAKLDSSNIEDKDLVRKIKREGRIIEKLSRIKGEVKAEIEGNIVKLIISKPLADNIKPALDAVKEISWLLDITLR